MTGLGGQCSAGLDGMIKVVPAVCLVSILAGCQTLATAPEPVPEPIVPPLGGPEEALRECAFVAGIGGVYETEIFYDDGGKVVSVVPGVNVTDDEAAKANQCLAEAA